MQRRRGTCAPSMNESTIKDADEEGPGTQYLEVSSSKNYTLVDQRPQRLGVWTLSTLFGRGAPSFLLPEPCKLEAREGGAKALQEGRLGIIKGY